MRLKLGFAGGEQNDLQTALLAFGYGGAVDVGLVAVGGRELHLERAGAAQLYAVVIDLAGGQLVRAEAGAGVVHFKKLDRAAGAVFYGGVHMIRMAGGEGCGGDEQDCGRDGLKRAWLSPVEERNLHAGSSFCSF